MRIEAGDLVEYLVGAMPGPSGGVYRDEAFHRSRLSIPLGAAGRADVLADRLVKAGITLSFVSLRASRAVDVVLPFRQYIAEQDAWGRWLWSADRSVVLWLPRDPVVRRYDEHRRIEWARTGTIHVDLAAHGATWRIAVGPEGYCEFCVLRIAEDTAAFSGHVRSPLPIETLPLSKAHWLRYEGLGDIWQWMADGTIYKINPSKSHRAWVDQQLACTLYDLVTFLAEQTDKRVYRALAEWIAYAVLLSLPENGLWRHGSAGDRMETHFRLQVDGTTLLLNHYLATGRPVFLDGAERSAQAILARAEHLEGDRLWFLHDTLECAWDTACENYPRLFASSILGKTVGNTLCLNTHIWTLVLLHRLAAIRPAGPYRDAFVAGMQTLKDVLNWAPAQWVYRRLYAGYDALVRRAVGLSQRRTRKLARRYERVLKWILPVCKKRWPRLFMPNGFIERDLCATALSGGYHFVTLRDLAVLYAECRQEWLRPFVERALQYSLRTRLAEYLAPADPRGAFLIDALALCAYAIDTRYREPLGQLLWRLRETALCLSPDVLVLPILRPWAREHAGWIVRMLQRDGGGPT